MRLPIDGLWWEQKQSKHTDRLESLKILDSFFVSTLAMLALGTCSSICFVPSEPSNSPLCLLLVCAQLTFPNNQIFQNKVWYPNQNQDFYCHPHSCPHLERHEWVMVLALIPSGKRSKDIEVHIECAADTHSLYASKHIWCMLQYPCSMSQRGLLWFIQLLMRLICSL